MDKDLIKSNEKLYTVREAAKICGIGRSTLLRMEEAGIVTPRLVNQNTGFRYYDVANIHAIMLYEMLQNIGMKKDEIKTYFQGELKEDFIDVLRERVTIAQRCLDEFEARFSRRESTSFSYVNLPAVDCYCFQCNIPNPKDQIEYNYKEIQRIYSEGYRPYPSTPMFSVTPDPYSVFDGNMPDPFRQMICISVYPDPAPDPSKIIYFERKRGFSMLFHGNRTDMMQNGGAMLWDEMQKLGIKPRGPLFGIAIIGPFFDINIDSDDYVFRWAVPIE